MAGTRMKYVMLLVRDVSESISFYGPSGLGLRVVSATQNWAELSMGPGPRLAIKAVDGEAACTTGYSPFLSFNVEGFDEMLPRLLQLGASLDGPIKHPSFGKVAALRTPDGHMISLLENEE